MPELTQGLSTSPGRSGLDSRVRQDGYRTELIVDDGKVRAFSRGDWTRRTE